MATSSNNKRLQSPFSACSSCHGRQGRGLAEGGSSAPPIDLASLLAGSDRKPGYRDIAAISLAIEQGRGRDGTDLSSIMPRYRLEPGEKESLLAYLSVVGTAADLPPGVTDQQVKVGALLPLTGKRAALGQSILIGLQSVFEKVNDQGGIYGRKIDLRVEDVAGGEASAALRLARQNVYVLNGSLLNDSGVMAQAFSGRVIDDVANLSSRQQDGAASADSPRTVYLMPSRQRQIQELAAALRTCPKDGAIWAVGQQVDGAPENIKWFENAAVMEARLGAEPTPACLGYSLSDAIRFSTVQNVTHKVVEPLPYAILEKPDVNVWRDLGEIAAAVLLESLSEAGANLNESSPIDALYGLGSFEPVPGARIHFSERRTSAWDPEVISLPSRTTQPQTQLHK